MRRQRLMKPSQYHGVSFEFLWLNLISQHNFQIEWRPFISLSRGIKYIISVQIRNQKR